MNVLLSNQVVIAPFPPELLGKRREDVRLIVINRESRDTVSTSFENLPAFINSGDVLVFNNSSVVRASIPAFFPSIGSEGFIHVGTSTEADLRLVEIRPKKLNGEIEPKSGAILLGTKDYIEFVKRHDVFGRFMWAKSSSGSDLLNIAEKSGKILRYGHIPFDVPESYYKNFTGQVPGSVEYPSAARPLTGSIIQQLKNRGVQVKAITLHCNLGSMEPQEFYGTGRLLDEQYRIPEDTARTVNYARKNGRKVIAVGTSVVRALESSVSRGLLKPGNYSTELYIHGNYNFRIVDSIVTGMHEELGSHIGMISAFTGNSLLEASYSKATEDGFTWHEFGDLALII